MANGRIQVGLTPEQTAAQQAQFAQMIQQAQAGGQTPVLPPRPNYNPQTRQINPAPAPLTQLPLAGPQMPTGQLGGAPGQQPQPAQLPSFQSLAQQPGMGLQQQPVNPFQPPANVNNPFASHPLGAGLQQLAYNPGAAVPPPAAPAAPAGQAFNAQPPFFRPPGTPSIENLPGGGSFLNAPIYTPQQQLAFGNILGLAGQRFANPEAGFQPIEERARRQFAQTTVPSLAERFTAMGGGQRSSAFQGALGAAGSELESQLAQYRGQYGQQAEQQALQQLNLGLTPLYNQQYTEPFSAGQAAAGISSQVANAATQLLPSLLSGGLGAAINNGTATPAAAGGLLSSLGLSKGAASLAALAPYLMAAGLTAGGIAWLANVVPDWFAPEPPPQSQQPAQLANQVQIVQQNPAALSGLSPQARQYAQQNNMPLPTQAEADAALAASRGPQAAPAPQAIPQPIQPAVPQMQPAAPPQPGPAPTGQATPPPTERPLPRFMGATPSSEPTARKGVGQIVPRRGLPAELKGSEENPIIRAEYARQGGTVYPTHVYFKNAPNVRVPVPEQHPNIYGAQQKEEFANMLKQGSAFDVVSTVAAANARRQEFQRTLEERGRQLAEQQKK